MSTQWLAIVVILFASLSHADEFDTNAPRPDRVDRGGDQFNSNSSGPTTTNQPGVGDSPFCRQRDPECGGTDRRCYDDAYRSQGVVLSIQESQQLYRETRGQIWIRCGACGDNTICWPRPGFEQLIAQGPNPQPTAPREPPPEEKKPCTRSSPVPKDFLLIEIERLRVVNANTHSGPDGHYRLPDALPADPSLRATRVATNQWLASGTFAANYRMPAGPIIRGGVLDTSGDSKALPGQSVTVDGRGGIAVLDDGNNSERIVIARQQGRRLEDIKRVYGPNVRDFMGGGAMLIDNGFAVDDRDLFEKQAFYEKGGAARGFQSGQFRGAPRTLVGTRDGIAFLIVSTGNKTGKKVQSDLCRSGFRNVVMFDGGSGFYFNGQGDSRATRMGTNPTGLLVTGRLLSQ